MINKLGEYSIKIDDVFYCPFQPEFGIGIFKKHSFFRKPNPGMLIHAINKHNINPNKSIMIGDKETDKLAAIRAGIPNYVNANDYAWDEKLLEMANSID